MLAKIFSAAVLGINAYIVEVEAHLESQLPAFATVGLPDSAVRKSRERVNAAIKNSNLPFPQKRITINLAPADIKKEGSSYDLPIAIGILAASGVVSQDHLDDFVILGELSLDGSLRPPSMARCPLPWRLVRISTKAWCCHLRTQARQLWPTA